MKYVHYRLYLAVLPVLFTGVIFESLNSDRLILILSMVCLLVSIIFYPVEKIRGIQKFAFIPLVVALLFEGIFIPIGF
jgi:hypothetical protein